MVSYPYRELMLYSFPLIQWRSVSLTRFECQSDISKVTRLQQFLLCTCGYFSIVISFLKIMQQEFNVNEWLEHTPEHLYFVELAVASAAIPQPRDQYISPVGSTYELCPRAFA